ncbi:uncharacterized protein GLRG_07523 [Colletotrichum graminicola M1.001]|uniref:Uncharacterized protein n=1 Tax=Colletotrichum graminicola (strain M1.001 / M2 / FGSC 10212) TaxID=645133 RepID=E3QNE1_COLGM|nr:uncharacterized protein GLRG_07523 [Colletotrichum graminicola M1.001]EFQ32379.1 hypothetical protein GLRG_07523 [Colletotrichum graminicola M1.001]
MSGPIADDLVHFVVALKKPVLRELQRAASETLYGKSIAFILPLKLSPAIMTIAIPLKALLQGSSRAIITGPERLSRSFWTAFVSQLGQRYQIDLVVVDKAHLALGAGAS